MKSFLRNSLSFPAKSPKLNRAHPLYNQEHMLLAAVANVGGGMTDLVSGVISTNTGVSNDCNELGPCVWSNGVVNSSAFLSWPNIGNQTLIEFFTVGALFKFLGGTNQQYLIAWGATTGIFIINSTIVLLLSNGNVLSAPLKTNHCYHVFVRNSVGTANNQRMLHLYDITEGMTTAVVMNASTGNQTFSTITALQNNNASTGPNHRLAAVFMSGSVSVPPSVVNPPTFNSIDQIVQATIDDPWGLWYGS